MSLIKEQIKERGKRNMILNQSSNHFVKNQFARFIRRQSSLQIKKMVEGGAICEGCDINSCFDCLCVDDSHPQTNRYNGWYD